MTYVLDIWFSWMPGLCCNYSMRETHINYCLQSRTIAFFLLNIVFLVVKRSLDCTFSFVFSRTSESFLSVLAKKLITPLVPMFICHSSAIQTAVFNYENILLKPQIRSICCKHRVLAACLKPRGIWVEKPKGVSLPSLVSA